jgi:DNA-binding transcriptional LysR family regulator
MDLSQLEAFVQVAAHRSFSRAAEALFLTQPSVTARIQALEREIGEPLFERNGRGVRLTDVGDAFLPYAERVLKALQEGRDALDGIRNLEIGTLRLGSAFTVSAHVLPHILKEFRTRYPRIDVSVRTGRSYHLLQMVLADEVQAAMVRSISHPDIQTIELYQDEVVLVTDPQHPFASLGEVTIEEVGRQPLILFDRGSSYRNLIQSLFEEAGVVPHEAMELDSLEATKKMVEEGLGIALLPRAALDRELELGFLSEVGLKGIDMPRRRIAFIYRKHRRHGRPVLAFIELLRETYHFDWPPESSIAQGTATA